MWQPYKGLNDAQVKRMQQVYPDLKTIESITQVPWQLLAGIWYRESFSVTPPARPGGCWQFDPVPNEQRLKGWLDRYTSLAEASKETYLKPGEINTFLIGGVFAGCLLQEKVHGQLKVPSQDFLIKDAIWGYNGRVYGSADNSPYVICGYDKAHYPMREIGSEPDGKGGRIRIDEQDFRSGAFTVYKQLMELFP